MKVAVLWAVVDLLLHLSSTFNMANAQLAPQLHRFEQQQRVQQGSGSQKNELLEACTSQRRAVRGKDDLNGIFQLSNCLLSTAASDQTNSLALQAEAQRLLFHIIDLRADLFEARFALGLAFIDSNPLLAYRVFEAIFNTNSDGTTGLKGNNQKSMVQMLTAERVAQLHSVAANVSVTTGHFSRAKYHISRALGIDNDVYNRGMSSTTGSGSHFPGDNDFHRQAAATNIEFCSLSVVAQSTTGASSNSREQSRALEQEEVLVDVDPLDQDMAAQHVSRLRQAASVVGPKRVSELLLLLATANYLEFEQEMLTNCASEQSGRGAEARASLANLLVQSYRSAVEACRLNANNECWRFLSVLQMTVCPLGACSSDRTKHVLDLIQRSVETDVKVRTPLGPSAVAFDVLLNQHKAKGSNITVMHAARPTVATLHNFLSDEEADTLRLWHQSHTKGSNTDDEAVRDSMVCFTPTSKLLHKLIPTDMGDIARMYTRLIPGSDNRICVARRQKGRENEGASNYLGVSDGLVTLLRDVGFSSDEAVAFLDAVDGVGLSKSVCFLR